MHAAILLSVRKMFLTVKFHFDISVAGARGIHFRQAHSAIDTDMLGTLCVRECAIRVCVFMFMPLSLCKFHSSFNMCVCLSSTASFPLLFCVLNVECVSDQIARANEMVERILLLSMSICLFLGRSSHFLLPLSLFLLKM
jgi:hypothetical protein